MVLFDGPDTPKHVAVMFPRADPRIYDRAVAIVAQVTRIRALVYRFRVAADFRWVSL